MLEILVVMAAIAIGAVLLVLAARKGRGMGRYIKGNIDLDFALGTLAPQDVVVAAIADAVVSRSIITSIECTYSLSGYTVVDNAGPIQVGVAHFDYSDAEIEEWIELVTGWDEGNLQSREVANRRIRSIGSIPMVTSLAASPLNDGRPIKTKLNWVVNPAQGLKFWAYNQGSAALATTDPDMHVTGHANIFPRG